MNGIHTSRGEALRQSRSVVESAKPPKGLGRDGYKPLMRNRTGQRVPSPNVILTATLSAGTLAVSGYRNPAASRAVNANANERGPNSSALTAGADSCGAASVALPPINPTGHGASPARAAEIAKPDSALGKLCSRGQITLSPVGQTVCRKCGRKAVYIRTRYFERGYSKVWMCENERCTSYRLYFHTDHKQEKSGAF